MSADIGTTASVRIDVPAVRVWKSDENFPSMEAKATSGRGWAAPLSALKALLEG
jgi:hypothetical protein